MTCIPTKTAVSQAIWPYLFGVICLEANDQKDPEPVFNELYNEFEGYLVKWSEELPKHARKTFMRHITKTSQQLIDLCHDKQACEGKGGNSTTKTMGVFKGIMENMPVVQIDGFKKFETSAAKLEGIIYKALSAEYDAQYDSGSIERKVVKGIEMMKGFGYA